MFTLSVRQSTFIGHFQGTTAPFEFMADCALKCLSTYRCRAIKFDQDLNGNFLCQILNDTENLASQAVLERRYPTPTLNGRYLVTTLIDTHLSFRCRWHWKGFLHFYSAAPSLCRFYSAVPSFFNWTNQHSYSEADKLPYQKSYAFND